MDKYILSYDVGTTSTKTCIYSFNGTLKLESSAGAEYSLYISKGGIAEQNPKDWVDALAMTTKKILYELDIKPTQIAGISFCSQMQGLILIDKNGEPIRPAMSYMDNRGTKQKDQFMKAGPRVMDLRVDAAISGLIVNGGVPASSKDPIWKYLWVKENHPKQFKKIKYWLDVKEYLIYVLTGNAIMTEDTAFATFLYDTRKNRGSWNKGLIKKYKVEASHLPIVIQASDIAGYTTESAANVLGLIPGIPVFGSGGDATLIPLGSGTTKPGDTHIYTGTSGWVSTIVDKRKIDIDSMIASVPAANSGFYNFFAEQETAGKCLEWVKDHLALDEINVYLSKKTVIEEPSALHKSLYSYLVDVISKQAIGSGGVIFTPWLHGNRSPFEDPNSRGMFFNLSLETGKASMIRAVLEGIIFNQFWLLESIEKSITTNKKLRFVGGAAQNKYISQMIADIFNRTIEVPEGPQYVGANGAAIVAAVGLNWITSFDNVSKSIKIAHVSKPNYNNHLEYRKNYLVFKKLYKANKKLFNELNN
ncbi:MAG: FGGY-family carbohydrate kinase [Spirochaetaceae bacterium]